jgi:isopenicillin N synthase-like dioxygenase
MTPSLLTVPTIDISGWYSGDTATQDQIARAVDDASRTVGFMQIIGHGISDGVVAQLTSAMDDFFSLPLEEKQRSRPPSSAVNRGYTAPRSERLSHSLGLYSPDDLFEAFNVGSQAVDFPNLDLPIETYSENIWPSNPDSFRTRVQTWFENARGLAKTMTSIFARAVGMGDGYFDQYTDHSIDMLRMNNYRLPADDLHVAPDQLGMGPHTDFGIVTILWADPLPGLQILDSDGTWLDVVPKPGALLINLGDLLARWTNDQWRSTMHRVSPPVDSNGHPFRRRSAAFFHDGNADAVITTLPTCATQGTDTYEPVTVAEHITAKLAGSRGLELNTLAEREAARLRRTH